ncbi:penicillin-binding protein 2 [Gracilimonas sediminicola]|uniref:Penicillin-binding protein 2 n=1 Tax=Gracilimonas sediminicola TaxID=2952158 RepID=A0A9X2L450_9BACT|nr:penicillin-binding protein 2 [Gracilimonas sediminicola]MCP9292006.1 penicillin-binding protein 2 [Gracilimonas sediminicola]
MSTGQTNRTRTSIRALQVIILGLTLIVLGRIFYLQIVEYEVYAALGQENSVRQEYVDPARGLIYDRNGNLIVDNEPIFSITITPSLFDKSNIPLLADLLGVSDSLLTTKVQEAQQYSWHRTSRLFTEIDFPTFSAVQENLWQLPGIGHQIESKRHYPTEMKASHLLGYLREANENEYRQSETIRLGDKIGKSGLEMIYEDSLRGELGIRYLKVNAFGQALGEFEGNEIGRNPEQGSNIITTIDTELQIFAEKLMEGKRGAVVAMNPNTGAILAMVSSPTYDLSKLAGRLDQDYWQAINADSTTPLYNRAISSRQPPGSTFKPLMGIIGLHMGIITPQTKIYNSGAYVRGRAYRDLAPVGEYDLKKAITFSSNTYFFSLMDKIASQGKLNEWSSLVKDFGLGVASNVDLPNANSGLIPDSTYLNRRLGERRWGLGDLINFGVGQGMVSVSPIQIAQMTSIFANGGYRVKPHLVQVFKHPDGSISRLRTESTRIDWLRDEYLEVVKAGMRGVVTEGSGRWYANHPNIEIAGKTGTAQNPHGMDHGWFTSYAPLDNPEIVVTAFVENAGFASTSAAPIASLVIEKYLQGEITRPYVYDYVLNFEPKEEEDEQPAPQLNQPAQNE